MTSWYLRSESVDPFQKIRCFHIEHRCQVVSLVPSIKKDWPSNLWMTPRPPPHPQNCNQKCHSWRRSMHIMPRPLYTPVQLMQTPRIERMHPFSNSIACHGPPASSQSFNDGARESTNQRSAEALGWAFNSWAASVQLCRSNRVALDALWNMVVMFNVPSALYGATASFVLFRVLHWQACRRLPVPSSLKHFEGRTLKRKLWKYRNIALSFFHSTVTAIGSVLWWVSVWFRVCLWRGWPLVISDRYMMCSLMQEPGSRGRFFNETVSVFQLLRRTKDALRHDKHENYNVPRFGRFLSR